MRLAQNRVVSPAEPATPEVPSLAILQRGRLSGMGRSAGCELLAWGTALDWQDRYTHFRVIAAPDDLPDGVYLAEFDGRCGFATRKAGRWKIESLDKDVCV